MRYLLVFLLAFLAACDSSGATKKQPTLSLVDLNQSSTWWELKQYFNGVPKYSGSFGTYTAKHTPIAIKHNNKTYYTYSDNSDGVLRVYVSDGVTKTEVHHSSYLNDPHSNGTISVDSDGHILVYVSARAHVELGAIYRSIAPNDISGFYLVNETWMAYPQPWETSTGQVILHTIYEIFEGKNQRNLYVKTDSCNKKIVEGGHYQVSTYDGSRLHTYYNYHPNGSVDSRKNIYYMYSDDGCTWKNKDGLTLTLPVANNSPLTKIYDSGSNFIYLKDLGMKGSEPKLLYVESENFNPLLGDYNSRQYNLISPFTSPVKIQATHHNYNAGYYHYDGVDEYAILIISPPDNDRIHYAGGSLAIYQIGGGLMPVKLIKGYYNYARKVHNGNGEGFISQEINHDSGKMLKINL